ncbi:hypothetical protein CHUAL_011771 [Chamberlinius hualienensis]
MAKIVSRLSRLNLTNNRSVLCICRKNISYSCQNYFKSKYSLDKIYPNSSLNIAKKPEEPTINNEKFGGFIPMDKLTVTYSASSGPGGQHVNHIHTKVDLRFHIQSAAWLPEPVKPKMLDMYKNFINKDGFLVLKSDRTRSQTYNVTDCLDKLRFMIREAEIDRTPPPPSDEDITARLKRQEKFARERLREKRNNSDIRSGRGAASLYD